MKRVLIVQAGATRSGPVWQLTGAALAGMAGEAVDTDCRHALEAGLPELLAAQALLFITPEKFGYMAGSLKDFFDRTFYPAQGRVAGLPYALIVAAGNDGTGAASAVERICRGYPLQAVAEPLIVRGAPDEAGLAAARELGAALAAGLALGVF